MKLETLRPGGPALESAARLSAVIFRDPSSLPKPLSEIREGFLRHLSYPGFRGYILADDENEPLGFAYGYQSVEGQFYRSLLKARLSAEEETMWLQDCFEFVALGIHPEHRQRGYARILHDAVLGGVRQRTAILTTEVSNDTARRLYADRGWKTLHTDFEPRGRGEPFVIMVKEL